MKALFRGKYKWAAVVMPVLLIIFGVVYMAGETAHSADKTKRTVKAMIDQECKSVPGSFVVPEGKTAVSFVKDLFEAGKACDGGGTPDNRGYAIRDSKNRAVYVWSQYKDHKPYEKGGPLSSLSLGSGDYTLTVAGGAGGKVEITFELK